MRALIMTPVMLMLCIDTRVPSVCGCLWQVMSQVLYQRQMSHEAAPPVLTLGSMSRLETSSH